MRDDPNVNPTGLCGCGCGQRTRIWPRTYIRIGVRKGEPQRYIVGHNSRGRSASEETRRKMSEAQTRRFTKPETRHKIRDVLTPEARAKISRALTGRPKSPEHRRKISLAMGGTGEACASVIHQWLKRNHPKSGVCEECGKEGKTDYAFKHHPEPHTRDRADYRELCPLCHNRFDRGSR